MSDLPPVMRDTEEPGYVWFDNIKCWVRIEDAYMVLDVLDEIGQADFASKRHGTRHVRNLGCKGPLCKKALRDWRRTQYEASMKIFRPIRRFDDLLDRMLEVYDNFHGVIWPAPTMPEPELQDIFFGDLLAA